MSNLIAKLPKIRGGYRENVDLSKINWFGVGGKAEVVFRPEDANDLAEFLKNISPEIKITVLGVGSNILVRDGGLDGVVIRLGRGFTENSCDNDEITAGAACLGLNVAKFAASHSIGGLEFLSGIPGTIGGALFMNAGAYGSDTSTILKHAEAVDESGNIHILKPEDIGYVYRGNSLPTRFIFTKATFKSEFADKQVILDRIEEINNKRVASQPIKSRTSGSTFKNPPDHSAWKLIDEAGCRGLKMGGAEVSQMHCNFFINHDGATAKDIEDLGLEVIRRVKETSGVELKWEVQIIGNK